MPSAATHAVLPLARHRSPGGGCRSTPGFARTSGASARREGFWLPECAYVPGLEAVLGRARRSRYTCLDQSSHERGTAALRPDPPAAAARSRSRSTGRPSSWSGRTQGYPSDPRLSRVPPALAKRDAALVDRRWPLRPGRRGEAGGRARRVLPGGRRATASSAIAPRRGRRGLCVFAIDTELLGHWWAEGPRLAARGARGRGARRRARC